MRLGKALATGVAEEKPLVRDEAPEEPVAEAAPESAEPAEPVRPPADAAAR